MTRDEHSAQLKKLHENLADPEIVSEVITHLSEDYAQELKALEDDATLMAKLKESNDKLIKANGALLMKVTAGDTEEEQETEVDPDEVFNGLFDADGNLK